MILVDTSVWVDFFRGTSTPEVTWLEAALTVQRIGLTEMILCEILQGVANEQQARELYHDLIRFEILTAGGIDLAVSAARNYRSLRAKGITIRRTIDCIIATFCIQNDHRLLHNDRDFDPFEQQFGLLVVHP